MKKTSVAQSIIQQVHAKNITAQKVITLSTEKIFRAKFRHSVESGREVLYAQFPEKDGRIHEIDITEFLILPNLWKPLAEGFIQTGVTKTPLSRKKIKDGTVGYFIKFLGSSNLKNIDLESFTEETSVSYGRYLDERKKGDGEPLSVQTKAAAVSCIGSILEGLKGTEWANDALRIQQILPRGLKGFKTKTIPTKVITSEQLKLVVRSCNAEILELHSIYREGQDLLEQEAFKTTESSASARNWADIGHCLTELDKTFKGPIPDLGVTVKNVNPGLAYGLKKYHTKIDITRYFQPSPRDLVPFVVLLTIATAFNPDTILTQTWKNTIEIDRLGQKAFRFIGHKPRSSEDQMQIIEDSSNTVELDPDHDLGIGWTLDLLKKLTSRIRNFVETDSHKDRLFIYVNKTRDKTPRSFGTNLNTSPSADPAWSQNLRRFCKQHNLEGFTLKQIRKTIIDMNTYMSGDIQAGRKIAGHTSVWTTYNHYTSDATKRRWQEELGRIFILRERWHETNGAIDPRKLRSSDDHMAATPGFRCCDPFDSPRPNQKKNSLCKAYGECPDCPMAAASLNDSVCVAYYVALKGAIYSGSKNMSPQSWLLRWGPVAKALENLIEQIPEDVMNSASMYKIKLPAIG